jgi:hypothetical protein
VSHSRLHPIGARREAKEQHAFRTERPAAISSGVGRRTFSIPIARTRTRPEMAKKARPYCPRKAQP